MESISSFFLINNWKLRRESYNTHVYVANLYAKLIRICSSSSSSKRSSSSLLRFHCLTISSTTTKFREIFEIISVTCFNSFSFRLDSYLFNFTELVFSAI